ncbi:MAG TPA: hypothetical protein VGK42_10135 [Candidatus Dormibacteraeota bacterium]|jgi:hypothetical protein
MSRAAPAERAAAAKALAEHWPILLREVGAFANSGPEGSASKLGRLETFFFLYEWPDRLASQAAREVERAAERAANGDNGHRPPAARR